MKAIQMFIVIIALGGLMGIQNKATAAQALDPNIYLPDKGMVMNWEIDETAPKRPKPILLNPTKYDLKWKLENSLPLNLVQDQQGVLYFSDFRDKVNAVYPNGEIKWSVKLDAELTVTYLLIGKDDTLYAYSKLDNEDTIIYAIAENGTIKWKKQSKDIISRYNNQFAGDSEGNLIVFTTDGLVSYNSSGEANWLNKTVSSTNIAYILPQTIHTDNNSNIYVDTDNQEIISIDKEGKLRWKTSNANFLDGKTFFKPYFSAKGLIYSVTPSGLHMIESDTGTMIEPDKLDFADIQSSGLPSDGKGGFYLDNSGNVAKMDHLGEVKWQYKTRDTEKYGLGLLDGVVSDKDGNVYFTGGVGNIYGLNSEGQEFFVLLRNAFWYKSVELVIGKNNNIYAINNDIGLTSFGKKQIQIFINNLSLPMSLEPINNKGTVLVPFRDLFEGLGLKVEWDQETKLITGSKEGLTIQFKIGDKFALVNGVQTALSNPPELRNGNTFVPLRFISEATGSSVKWNGKNSSINIEQK
ncbi:stalk domain-containing protein [Paenibacillus psychroresistens]|nr:stalk domain-containing protein [Paenibacillus psychroresistens]